MNARRPATEFPPDLDWVNTDAPPQLEAWRGRVVLLWFWSYDSVNCWNLIADVRKLEDKYHDGLAVVGVHCPKYPHQRDSAQVLHAVNRFGVRHAVANDLDFRIWQDYLIDAWPSVALVDADGALAAVFAGEGRRNEIDARISLLLDEAAAHDRRVYEPIAPSVRPEPRSALAFPGKLLVDEQRLYVSDSGHHRVLECNLDGRVLRTFGSGNGGYSDGVATLACFDRPQGLAKREGALFVADSGNHCVRRVDLADGRVDTILGNGRSGRSRPVDADARSTVLNTPLDLAIVDEDLYIAVAGQNQIWRLGLGGGLVSILAGSGDLGLADGSGEEAIFAQPCGLATLGRELIVADAASSSVRAVGVDSARVETVVGRGLYDFGDVVGARIDVRLQNPLAVAADPRGVLYVADSYNDAIKLLNRRSGEARLLRMSHPLHEPQGLCLTRDALWIANTNRHEIVRIDLASGGLRRVPVGET
jgi:hypothetical protein